MPTILFYETGYSTHVLRQASRRSWRIGQKQAVRVCYMSYFGTAQERCLRLMGKKSSSRWRSKESSPTMA